MVIVPSDTTIVNNTTILLTCFGYGIPTPAVMWSTGEEILSNDSQIAIYNNLILENGIQFVRSILKLCSTTVSHNGEYTCRLSNAAGNSNASFYLEVLSKCIYSIHNISMHTERSGGKPVYIRVLPPSSHTFVSFLLPLSCNIP